MSATVDWEVVTGDALELIPTLDDGSVSLVVTSPPYPGQYGDKRESWWWLVWMERITNLLWSRMTPNGVLVMNVQFKRRDAGWFDESVLTIPKRTPFHLLDIYLYGKLNPPPNGPLTFCDPPGWEFIFVLTKAARPEDVVFNPVRRPYAPKSVRKSNGKLYSNKSAQAVDPHPDGARQTTLMLMSKSADQNRPSAKGISFPRALPERFIRQYTNPGALVLDPFCGVGTTLKMAVELGRRAIGYEIDADEAERARAWLREPVQGTLGVGAAWVKQERGWG